MDQRSPFKVRLQSVVDPSDLIIFDVTPSISEGHVAEYDPLDFVHGPGSFMAYRGSKATSYELSAVKLISRTSKEARLNLTLS